VNVDSFGFTPLPEVETKTEDIAYTRTKTKVKAPPNCSPLPADLPREVVVMEPEEDDTGMSSSIPFACLTNVQEYLRSHGHGENDPCQHQIGKR
jgi:hypothetical protein